MYHDSGQNFVAKITNLLPFCAQVKCKSNHEIGGLKSQAMLSLVH